MKPRYDWILMDADRTLFDFDRSEQESIRKTLTHYGIPSDDETVAVYLEGNLACWDELAQGRLTQDALGRERFQRLLDRLGITGPDPGEMNLFFLHGIAAAPYLIDGAVELCKQLKPHCTLAIVTNGLTVAQKGRLENSELKPYIDHLFISQEMGCKKPEPAYFERVFSVLGIGEEEKKRTIILGDSCPVDIQGGINVGIDTIWLNSAGKKCPENMKITHIVASLAEVSQIILQP